MPDYISATVFTNLDPKTRNTPQQFHAIFPAVPQIGHVVEWDDRRCHICDISWKLDYSNGHMKLMVEINK